MLKAIINTKQPFFWIIIHLLLGFSFTLVREFFVIWFFLVIVSSLNIITKGSRDKKKVHLIYLVTYLSSLELLSRMTHAFKYRIPWEYGKYVIFFGALYAILVLNSRKGPRGLLLFLLLLPAIFLTGDYDIEWRDIVFNLFGPIAISVVIISNTKLRITKHQFKHILKLMLYPALSVLAYVIVKTPDLDSIQFNLEANFEATGGYGSNQVSTILGLGLFLTFVFWVNNWELSGNRKVDLVLMFGFFFQGLLSFSRGGMVGGILAILILVFMISKSGAKNRKNFNIPKVGKFLIPAVIFLVITFQIADSVTKGMLRLRYQGETTSTLAGSREVDINTLTTGRFTIFQEDFDIWMDNFTFGAGVGISKYIRSRAGGIRQLPVASHVELSRLLAEHGLLGLLWFAILIVSGLRLIKHKSNSKFQGVLLALFLLGIYTTFHAATRTYLTPLLIGISVLSIVDIYNKELSKKEINRRKRVLKNRSISRL